MAVGSIGAQDDFALSALMLHIVLKGTATKTVAVTKSDFVQNPWNSAMERRYSWPKIRSTTGSGLCPPSHVLRIAMIRAQARRVPA